MMQKSPDSSMSFWDHLDELRARLIRICISLVVGASLGLWKAAFFIEKLTLPSQKYVEQLVYLKPATALMVQLKVGFLIGLLLTVPYALYELWGFVSPGLYPNEKKGVGWWILTSFVLVLVGCAFAYWIVLPIALRFLLTIQLSSIVPVIASITIDAYLSFTIQLIIAFGLVFQLPLVMFLASRIGLVSGAWFQKHRREAIVVIFIIAAILTPPDVVSQILLGVPLLILYELGALAAVIGKKRRELVG
jgi:sec-independent protein translocase protein TatC